MEQPDITEVETEAGDCAAWPVVAAYREMRDAIFALHRGTAPGAELVSPNRVRELVAQVEDAVDAYETAVETLPAVRAAA